MAVGEGMRLEKGRGSKFYNSYKTDLATHRGALSEQFRFSALHSATADPPQKLPRGQRNVGCHRPPSVSDVFWRFCELLTKPQGHESDIDLRAAPNDVIVPSSETAIGSLARGWSGVQVLYAPELALQILENFCKLNTNTGKRKII